MTPFEPDRVPDDLREVDALLRAHKAEVDPLELDRVKLQTMGRAFRAPARRQGGILMRSKLVTMMLVLGLAVSGGAAGVIAAGGGGGGGSADKGQYKPGKGCGNQDKPPKLPHTGPPGNPGNTDCPPTPSAPVALPPLPLP
jgi:hypothetical protein